MKLYDLWPEIVMKLYARMHWYGIQAAEWKNSNWVSFLRFWMGETIFKFKALFI